MERGFENNVPQRSRSLRVWWAPARPRPGISAVWWATHNGSVDGSEIPRVRRIQLVINKNLRPRRDVLKDASKGSDDTVSSDISDDSDSNDTSLECHASDLELGDGFSFVGDTFHFGGGHTPRSRQMRRAERIWSPGPGRSNISLQAIHDTIRVVDRNYLDRGHSSRRSPSEGKIQAAQMHVSKLNRFPAINRAHLSLRRRSRNLLSRLLPHEPAPDSLPLNTQRPAQRAPSTSQPGFFHRFTRFRCFRRQRDA